MQTALDHIIDETRGSATGQIAIPASQFRIWPFPVIFSQAARLELHCHGACTLYGLTLTGCPVRPYPFNTPTVGRADGRAVDRLR